MKKHLKGLDSLRAIAALVVLFAHVELLKNQHFFTDSTEPISVLPDSHLAVILFFVISGFLITFLLMRELKINDKISLKKFYFRRMLRILPLYYLVLFLSFLLVKTDHSATSTVLSIGVFPNLAQALGDGWKSSPQIWSIGVEENFYLLWPLLLSPLFFARKKTLSKFLVSFIVIWSLLPHILGFLNVNYFHRESDTILEKYLLFYGNKFNCIAIGAFIGVAYANRNTWINVFNSNKILFPLIIMTFSLWFLQFKIAHFNDELYAVLFAMIILSAIAPKTINIDNKVTSFLGKISYGIYMYHWIVIVLVIKYMPLKQNNLSYNFLLFFMAITVTIFVSWLSYVLFEIRFLNWKRKFIVFEMESDKTILNLEFEKKNK